MRPRTLGTAAALVTAVLLTTMTPAQAASGDNGTRDEQRDARAETRDGTPNVRADETRWVPASGGGTGSGGGGGITEANGYRCTWFPLGPDGQPVESEPYDPPPPDGTYAWLRCTRFGEPSIDGPTTRQSGSTVAASAVEALPLPGPQVVTNPSRGRDQVVGVPTWLWVENFTPLSVTATAGGTTALLVATPTSVTYDMGDGGPPLVCSGPGTPYDLSLPSSAQHTDCSYTYERSSAGKPSQEHTVTASMAWELRWEANTGQQGSLPVLTRSSTFPLRVAEAQALVTG